MDKLSFANLFEKALSDAEARVQSERMAAWRIKLHGTGVAGEILNQDEALEHLWIDGAHFYKIIDVGFTGASEGVGSFFVRASSHSPAEWSETWDPTESGPFKLIDFLPALPEATQ